MWRALRIDCGHSVALTSCQSWVWRGAHLRRSALASRVTRFLRSCPPAPGQRKAALQISWLVRNMESAHRLAQNIHPRQPYSGLQMDYLRLLWRISLRLIPPSFVFVFQLCGAFCILWASHSTRSDGKTSAVLAICWWRQQKNYIAVTLLDMHRISLASDCLMWHVTVAVCHPAADMVLSLHKQQQLGEHQPSQSGGGLRLWQELHSPVLHRRHATTFKVTPIHFWLFGG